MAIVQEKTHRINEQITAPKVRLIGAEGEPLGIVAVAEALRLADEAEDRAERGSTLIATQVPPKDWHASIGDPNLADAICDRLLHNAHRIELSSKESLRKDRSANPHGGHPER